MKAKNIIFIMLSIAVVLSIATDIITWVNPAFTRQIIQGEKLNSEKNHCALMIRKGKELFTRSRYTESKEYFRQAVQADPESQEAWSYYDLSSIYTVAEQFKNHGRIVKSTAPPDASDLKKSAESHKSSEEVPSAPTVQPPKVPAFKVMEDDGC
ncbi:putative Tetratricopeptide repeat protein [Candidatus Magnetomoraceae bacterium gMMP-15]